MSAHKDRLIQAADLLGMSPDDLLTLLDGSRTWGWQGDPRHRDDARPAPEGFAVFAHWSAAHGGINVEVDAPEGLPLTVHVSDWRAVNVVVGTDAEADPGDEPEPVDRDDMPPLDALTECLDLWGSGAWPDENAVYNLDEVMQHVDRLVGREPAEAAR